MFQMQFSHETAETPFVEAIYESREKFQVKVEEAICEQIEAEEATYILWLMTL